MKKKHFFYFFVCSIIFLWSCSSEEYHGDEDNNNLPTVTLTAGLNTRTTIDQNGNVSWTVGDVINVNGAQSDGAEIFNNGTTAIFKNIVKSSSYSALYPSTIYKSYNGGVFQVTLPNTQSYKDDISFSDGENISVAFSNNNSLAFKNACGLLKLTLRSNTPINITSITLKVDKPISGTFSLNPQTAVLSSSSTNAVDKVKSINFGAAKTITSVPTTVFFVLPPADYDVWNIEIKNGGSVIHTWADDKNTKLRISKSKIVSVPISIASHNDFIDNPDGFAAPRIYVSGSGDAARLMLTKDPANYGAFFQYGSVRAFVDASMTSAFDPTSDSAWKSTWDSTPNVHTATTLREGKGDPCRLVGYSLSHIKSEIANGFAPDNRLWKLPANNDDLSGGVWDDTLKGCYFGSIFLPAAGARSGLIVEDRGLQGGYWTGGLFYDDGQAMLFYYVDPTYTPVVPAGGVAKNNALTVRCVHQ